MPVLTERELAKRKPERLPAAQPSAPEAPEMPVSKKPETVDLVRVRMFHPDDIQSGSISCEFDLQVGPGIEKIKIERGVAAVTRAAASILEGRGWIRGKEKEQYE
jgi:hypothetical protein